MTNVIVKSVELLDQSIGLAVRVVVANSGSRNVKAVAISSRARRNNGNVIVDVGDGLEEQGEAVLLVTLPSSGITREPVFVSNLDVVKLEWLWVTKFGSTLAPFGVSRATDEFDFVKGVVNDGLEVFLGCDVTVEGQTRVDADDCEEILDVSRHIER
jgi:hypothetical protein